MPRPITVEALTQLREAIRLCAQCEAARPWMEPAEMLRFDRQANLTLADAVDQLAEVIAERLVEAVKRQGVMP